ncbi:MAG: thioredoxin domain-containing protein [Anaerolineae bacterium]|nr:thioredoxin domain-containing protein [Anaerolineae bacterium]
MSQQKSKKQKMAERRAKRQRQSQMQIIVGLSVVSVIVVVVIAVLTLRPKPPGDFTGLPQEIDRSGAVGIAIGKPDAPVTLVEYSDFNCSHCRNVAAITNNLIGEYAHDGRLRVVYKPVTIFGQDYSVPASLAAICAAEQGVGWQMIDHAWQIGGNYVLEEFIGIDPEVGLDTEKFKQCFTAPETAQMIDDVNAEAIGLGVQGTPTLYINGQPLEFLPGETSYDQALTRSIEAALGK